MVKLSGMLSRFSPVRVLVIGDFMLDTYTTGKVKRISPEAPVSVLHVQKEESRPGGAGNVVLNLVSLGAKVIAVGRIGYDIAGEQLRDSLESEGVDTENIFLQKGYKTPVKNRLIADAQQVLRVDCETVSPLSENVEEQVLERLSPILDKVNIVAISDYGKGFLSRSLLKKIIEMSREKEIPVIVDPKGDDFSKYQGATVIKPNLTEAYAAAKLPVEESLENVASNILKNCGSEMLLITRSEAGISLFNNTGQRVDFPVRSKEVKDVTGAGDTVLAMISVALANKLDIRYGAQLANIAAGMAIERLGCARINISEMAERLLEYDVENKIFDEEHLYALQQALKGKRYSVLGLDSTQGMSTTLFRSLRKLASRDSEKRLIVYVRDNDPDEEFVSLLSSLAEVDFIVLKCESLKNLCEIIHPHQVFVIEEDRLVALDHATALLSRVRDAMAYRT
ncbi:MAG: D-glycero-beta-D-manno-heptose-7-phosphate kinase [Parachlamydiales bacterium]|nr:D-glycero-beta-D-manno-heptose-7-phosphate kinase [Verrucomicrobiota bacterium]MBX3718850.1 D-glycero-beta-D-manno-heptose-7-phosphate kinase [Candidatus Acheromyda pituitae]